MAESYVDDDDDAMPGRGTGDGPIQTPQTPAFILAPLNANSHRVTEHPRNKYWQYPLDATNHAFGLWIDFQDPDKLVYTLGRAPDTDVYLPDVRLGGNGTSQISDIQASFQIVPDTGAVLLYDHSDHANTEPFQHTPTHASSTHQSFTVRFRPGANSVIVARGINTRIAFGRDRWYQFELRWVSDGLYGFNHDEPLTMGPRHSRTKKYIQGDKVGGGAYGTVWWAVDATQGTLMAVKKFHNLSGKNLEFATREVANLFRINKSTSIQHVSGLLSSRLSRNLSLTLSFFGTWQEHILQILDYAGGGPNDTWGEIIMPLKEGNLKTLVEREPDLDAQALSDTVLRQMLLALQCIASHAIVHRDIKPENILWEYDNRPGQPSCGYHFCLGDFGLSNDPNVACTVAGTEPFMAPEVFHRKTQTTKVDIWSLFATVVWVRNTSQFRSMCSQLGAVQIHSWLVDISTLPEYGRIRMMASMNPRKRPSAEMQLAILDGIGDEGDEDGDFYDESMFDSPAAGARATAADLMGLDHDDHDDDDDQEEAELELGRHFHRAMSLRDHTTSHRTSSPNLLNGGGGRLGGHRRQMSEMMTTTTRSFGGRAAEGGGSNSGSNRSSLVMLRTTPPEIPYYEPYTSGLMDQFNELNLWVRKDKHNQHPHYSQRASGSVASGSGGGSGSGGSGTRGVTSLSTNNLNVNNHSSSSINSIHNLKYVSNPNLTAASPIDQPTERVSFYLDTRVVRLSLTQVYLGILDCIITVRCTE